MLINRKNNENIKREKMVKSFLVLYLLMVLGVSYTAFNSPFVGENYNIIILVNSLVLFFTSFYLIGFSSVKKWWDETMKQAKYRAELRREVEKEIIKRKEKGLL